jgi:preprotein translocase subunit SecA
MVHRQKLCNKCAGLRGGNTFASQSAEGYCQMLEETDLQLLNSDADRAVQETMLIAHAGLPQRITVATNMAGRGTDIVLGGDSQQLLLLLLAHPHNKQVLESDPAYDKNTGGVKAGLRSSAAAFEVQVCCDSSSRYGCRCSMHCFIHMMNIDHSRLLGCILQLVLHSVMRMETSNIAITSNGIPRGIIIE